MWEELPDGDLPMAVALWAGLGSSKSDYQYDPKIGEQTAMTRNDKLDQSFEEIADAIEEHL